jgi:hypothetical protein
VIRISIFVIIEVVGFDHGEAKQGDIAIEMALSRFFIQAMIWLKISHHDWDWVLISTSSSKFFYLFRWLY